LLSTERPLLARPIAWDIELSIHLLRSALHDDDAFGISTDERTGPYVRLIDISPRNELYASLNAYYQLSSASMHHTREAFENLSYNEKASLLEKLIDYNPESVVALYTFEVLGEVHDLSVVSRYAQRLFIQSVSPRLGYASIDESEDETYETFFDESLAAHSRLHAEFGENIAQLACLRGHRVRYIFQITPVNLTKLTELQLMPQIANELESKHPLIHDKLLS